MVSNCSPLSLAEPDVQSSRGWKLRVDEDWVQLTGPAVMRVKTGFKLMHTATANN